MVVLIVIGAVIVALIAIMIWADRRDRAKGHVNRSPAEIKSMIRERRATKLQNQLYRRPPNRKGS